MCQVVLDATEQETITFKTIDDKIQHLLQQVIELNQTVKDLRDTNLELISIYTRYISLLTKTASSRASELSVTEKSQLTSMNPSNPDNTKYDKTLRFPITASKLKPK